MRRLSFFGAILALFISAPSIQANAAVVAKIDISSQTMRVYVNGSLQHTWKVSTGRGRYRTPTGSYSPKHMTRMHYSSKYNNSPMPYSIFFRGGYAVHGTNYVSNLGRPASHGCVRLRTSNARALYQLVQSHGRGSSRIVITH